jgi:hypothetical protein
MTEHIALELTAEEASRRIAADIRAYPEQPDKREEHLRLFGALLSREDIEGAWADRYAEIALAGRAKLARVSARFDALRPKIEETKQKLAEPKPAPAYRRIVPTSASFILSASQPTADPQSKDNAAKGLRPGVASQDDLADEEAKGEASSVEALVAKTELVQAGTSLALGTRALNRLLAAMNERHAVIGNVGGKCRVLEWVPSELDEGALLAVLQSKTDFINRYAHRQVGWTRKGEPLTAGEWWFEHPHRADYRGVVFKPGKPAVINHRDSGSWLNLWRGWGILPEKGRWPLLRKHIEQVLSGGDPKMADYIIQWTAWGFKNPGELPEAALVLRGKKGAGKGFFLGTIRRIYGPHGLQITHACHLTGNFNAHLWTCAYLFADEAFWAGDKQGEAVLKGLITERPLQVTKKGVDTITGVNCVKLAMSSNSYWVVPASHDERRYAASDIDPRYAKGTAPEEERKEYFSAIQRELTEGGAAAMLYDLLQMNLGDWHPREVPITTGLMRQKKESLRGNFQWLEPLLQSGTLPANYGRPNRITTGELLHYVKTFRGLEYATDESIASFLYDDMCFIPKLAPEGNKFRGSNGGPRGWEFPPLLDLRERWETLHGGQWDWHNPEIDEWQRSAGL